MATYTYYQVLGTIDGEQEQLFGSYDRNDCLYELDAERDSWKSDGYTRLRIRSKQVTEAPDGDIYNDNAITIIREDLDCLGFSNAAQALYAILTHSDWVARWDCGELNQSQIDMIESTARAQHG